MMRRRVMRGGAALLLVLGCQGDGTGTLGVAAELGLVSGDAQEAVVTGTLPEPFVVRVRDRLGRPVPGVPVVFGLPGGGGTFSADTVIADGEGLVESELTFGEVAGSFDVTIHVPDLVEPLRLSAIARPDAPVRFIESVGDNQLAAAGTVVPVSPQVEVLDRFDNRIEGVAISFSVSSGGGSVTAATGTTDRFGRFAVGTWRLGAAPGENSVIATTAGLPPLTFRAIATATSAHIQLSISDPPRERIVSGDSVAIRARAVGVTAPIVSVTARLGTGMVSLVHQSANEYVGKLSLDDVPHDSVALMVRATDVIGNFSETAMFILHDDRPVLTITAPLEHAVTRGTVTIDASCTDDDPAGCRSLLVYWSNTLIAQGTSRVNGTFQHPDDGGGVLTFRVQDSRGQVAIRARTVVPVQSPRLVELVSGAGVALDFANDRLLFIDSTAAAPRPVLRPVGGGADEVIAVPAGLRITKGRVVTGGAVLLHDFLDRRLYQWRDGALTPLGTLPVGEFRTAGDWLLYYTSALVRRNLVTLAEISLSAGNTSNDVAANGDVAYWSDMEIFRYRDGVSTPLTDDDVNWNTYPVTDGQNVVFRNHTPCCGSTQLYRIMLHDGLTVSELSPPRTAMPLPGLHYAVAGGWTAFTRPDASGITYLWTRSPAGVLRQVWPLDQSGQIEALAPNGAVAFSTNGRIYLAGAASAPENLMPASVAKVMWRETRFVALIGRWAFAIQ